MLGALCRYISAAPIEGFQPVNASFGLLPEAPAHVRKRRDRREARGAAAIRALGGWVETGCPSTRETA